MAKTYYTIQGDMWDGIAKKLYDDESGVNALLEANQQYADILRPTCCRRGGVKWKHVEYRRS